MHTGQVHQYGAQTPPHYKLSRRIVLCGSPMPHLTRPMTGFENPTHRVAATDSSDGCTSGLNIIWSYIPQILQKHFIHMQTLERLSFFSLLVPIVGLDGELGTVLRVSVAGLPRHHNFSSHCNSSSQLSFFEWPSSCTPAHLCSFQLCAAHLVYVIDKGDISSI